MIAFQLLHRILLWDTLFREDTYRCLMPHLPRLYNLSYFSKSLHPTLSSISLNMKPSSFSALPPTDGSCLSALLRSSWDLWLFKNCLGTSLHLPYTTILISSHRFHQLLSSNYSFFNIPRPNNYSYSHKQYLHPD
jgi:hypothetical protein